MHKALMLISTIILLVLTACGSSNDAASVESQPAEPVEAEAVEPVEAEAAEPAVDEAIESPEMDQVVLGVGFIPNVQFAPLYVAQAKGFYADEGLNVELEYGFENDFVALTAQGERQFAVASGDQVILARSQGLPVVYIMEWYHRFPVALMALSEMGIDSPEKVSGHSLGLPGLFGANYVAWKALAYAVNIDESTVDLAEIGFTQAEAISEQQVDAAMVYITNEPIQLQAAGKEVDVIEVSDYIDLVSNGLITNETVIQENPDLVRRLVQGSLRGLAYTIENPDEAFEIVRQVVPEITDEDAATQQAVLDSAIELWQTDQLGMSSPEAWAASAEFMAETGLIESPIAVDEAYTNEFIGETD